MQKSNKRIEETSDMSSIELTMRTFRYLNTDEEFPSFDESDFENGTVRYGRKYSFYKWN